MIFNYWPQWFRERIGGAWPKSYVCIDVETTGYSPDKDLVTEWGHVLVEDGQVTNRLSMVIDWTNHPVVPHHWLVSRMAAVNQGMQLAGRTCHHSIERMRAEGDPPDEALGFIRDFAATIKAKGIPFVAHGGMFDERMLAGNMIGFQIDPNGFSFGDDGWIDTEAIEKANQLVENERMHPRPTDTLRSYWNRIKGTRVNGVKSNMDEHCYTKYRFREDHRIEKAALHAAETDALCCHILMQIYGQAWSSEVQPSPASPSVDRKASVRTPPISQPLTPQTVSKRVRGQRNY